MPHLHTHRALLPLLTMMACSNPQEPADVAEPQAVDEAPSQVELREEDVTLGHQAIVTGMKSQSEHRTLIYEPDAEKPNDPEAAKDLVEIRSRRNIEVEEAKDDQTVRLKTTFDEVTIDTRGDYEEETHRTVLSGQSYLTTLVDDAYEIRRADGSEPSEEEFEAINMVETTIMRATHFTWLRNMSFSPGDEVTLDPSLDDLFQSLIATGQAVQGKLTYQGVTMRKGLKVAQFEVGLLSLQVSEIGTGQMGMSGQLWVDVESGWVDEVLLQGAMAATPEEGGNVRVRYENHADFTHEF